MSIQAVSWVLDHSRSRGIDRLVMISLANHASTPRKEDNRTGDDEDGGAECFPSMRTIASEAGVSLGAVSKSIGSVVKLGEVEVRAAGGPRRSARYRLTLVHEMNMKMIRERSPDERSARSRGERSARARGEQNHQEPSENLSSRVCNTCTGSGWLPSDPDDTDRRSKECPECNPRQLKLVQP